MTQELVIRVRYGIAKGGAKRQGFVWSVAVEEGNDGRETFAIGCRNPEPTPNDALSVALAHARDVLANQSLR